MLIVTGKKKANLKNKLSKKKENLATFLVIIILNIYPYFSFIFDLLYLFIYLFIYFRCIQRLSLN